MKKLLETESLPNVCILFQQMNDWIITNFNSIYIEGSTPISWSSSSGQRERERETQRERERKRERERERERKREEEESTLLWLSSLARVRLHLRCFGSFFFLSFHWGAFGGFSLANLEVRLPKVKFFLKIKSHKSSFFI